MFCTVSFGEGRGVLQDFRERVVVQGEEAGELGRCPVQEGG